MSRDHLMRNYNHDKENVSTNRTQENTRKFAYQHNNATSHQLQRLRWELEHEKDKAKKLQARIIGEQQKTLQTLEFLENRFKDEAQKTQRLEQENDRLTQQNQQLHQRFQVLQGEHKRIKMIGTSMVSMLRQVEGIEGTPKEAWKWLKRVVWEHQAIKTKALEWKAVYDQVSEAADSIGITTPKLGHK